mgnify:FL=1
MINLLSRHLEKVIINSKTREDGSLEDEKSIEALENRITHYVKLTI